MQASAWPVQAYQGFVGWGPGQHFFPCLPTYRYRVFPDRPKRTLGKNQQLYIYAQTLPVSTWLLQSTICLKIPLAVWSHLAQGHISTKDLNISG